MEKTLFISWSPKKWNTDHMLSYISEQLAWEKETILLKEKNIRHCLWCGFCEKAGKCAINDDMQDITQKLLRADVIVLWSPNYFANVSGMTKTFIDRLLPLYHSQSLKGKKTFLIMPWSSADSTNKKYLLQGTFGLIEYQNMKLLWAYGCCTEDKVIAEKKMENIAKQIVKVCRSGQICHGNAPQEMNRTVLRSGFALTRRHNSIPSNSGIATSESMRSGPTARATSSPRAPLSASKTW